MGNPFRDNRFGDGHLYLVIWIPLHLQFANPICYYLGHHNFVDCICNYKSDLQLQIRFANSKCKGIQIVGYNRSNNYPNLKTLNSETRIGTKT